MPAPRFITVKDVARMTTLAESTLFDWRAKGKGPRSSKFGARVVYVEAEVLEWIAAQQDATSSGAKNPRPEARPVASSSGDRAAADTHGGTAAAPQTELLSKEK